jgi:hypothetical protein
MKYFSKIGLKILQNKLLALNHWNGNDTSVRNFAKTALKPLVRYENIDGMEQQWVMKYSELHIQFN